MADKKISALTAATTPLAGTEVLPIVQSGSTVKATISNVLAPIQVTTTRAGINTAPTFSFHVLGSGEFGGMLAQSNVAGATSFTVQQGVTGVSNSGVTIRNADSAYDWLRFTATGGDVTVQTGNLIIGTAAKGITTGSAIPLGFGVNNTVTAMTIDTASNVGIGTATPSFTAGKGLHIYSTSSAALRMQDPSSDFDILSAFGGAYLTNRLNGLMSFGTNGTERVQISAGGNVGIGTTAAATALLDVQSTTKGVRFPNMTTAQKTAITPSAGTVIFDTTLSKLCVYSGAAWQTITSV